MNAGWAVALILPLAGCVCEVLGNCPPPTGSVEYTCGGGVKLPVAFGQEPDGTGSVVITVDGADYRLLKVQRPSQDTRYSWPSDGSNYVWQISEGVGTLLWHDGEKGTEEPRLTDCRAP